MTGLQIRIADDRDVSDIVALRQETGIASLRDDRLEDILFCRSSCHGAILAGSLDGVAAGAIQVGHDGHSGWLHDIVMRPEQADAVLLHSLVGAAESWLAERGATLAQYVADQAAASTRAALVSLGYVGEDRTVLAKRLEGVGQTASHRQAGGGITTVVSHLEMLAPPDRPPLAAPAPFRTMLLLAEQPSVAFYRYLYDNVGSPWTWVERRLMDDAALEAAITAPGVEVHVLHVNGVPAGYGEVDRRGRGTVSLAYFGLLPAFIGKGLGWYFLNAIIDIAWASAPARIGVTTCDLDHPRALSTYRRAGFRVFRQSEDHLPDPRAVGLPLPVRRTAANGAPVRS